MKANEIYLEDDFAESRSQQSYVQSDELGYESPDQKAKRNLAELV